MSATQQFQIVVRDTLPDFALSIGSTNLLLNETGSVRVLFSTRVPVTNVSFTLEIASDRLTDVSFTPRTASNTSVRFDAIGSNRYSGSVGISSGNSLQGTLELGALGFAVVGQPDSSIVPLHIAHLAGVRSDGTHVSRTAANSGRIFIVINEPLLEIDPSGFWRIRVHRLPGKTATLHWADSTVNPWSWSKLADFVARPFKTVDLIDDPSWTTARVYRATIPRTP
jgi:hypothetical protein